MVISKIFVIIFILSVARCAELYATPREYPPLNENMAYVDVIKSWGPPLEKFEYESKREELWLFEDQKVAFKNGKVLSWKEMGSQHNGATSPNPPWADPREDVTSGIIQVEVAADVEQILSELGSFDVDSKPESLQVSHSQTSKEGVDQDEKNLDNLLNLQAKLGPIKLLTYEEHIAIKKARKESGYVKPHNNPEAYFKREERRLEAKSGDHEKNSKAAPQKLVKLKHGFAFAPLEEGKNQVQLPLNSPVNFKKLRDTLFSNVDGSSIALFRMLFGLLTLSVVFRYWGRIEEIFLKPKLLFSYTFFDWVTPWPGSGMYIHFAVMGISAALVMLGLFYRLAIVVFFLCFWYFFLLEKVRYLNHYYLVLLVSFLLIFLRANAAYSIDKLIFPASTPKTVPFWNVFVLRAQFFVVYFFGGVAKVNYDWLRCEPLKQWFRLQSDHAILGPLLAHEWAACVFSYGGLLFDLLIGFLLLYRRTRFLALVGVVCFNGINSSLFTIGIFPWFMVASAIVFFDPSSPRKILNVFFRGRQPGELVPDRSYSSGSSRLVLCFLAVYIALQFLVPLRHLLFPGSVSWTEEGHRYSWRMKLIDKHGVAIILATDPKTGEWQRIDPRVTLTPFQYKKMATRPELIYQYVQYVKSEMKRQGVDHPVVRAFARVSLNGRPAVPIIDSRVNLADEKYSALTASEWILPLPKDLPLGLYIQEKPSPKASQYGAE